MLQFDVKTFYLLYNENLCAFGRQELQVSTQGNSKFKESDCEREGQQSVRVGSGADRDAITSRRSTFGERSVVATSGSLGGLITTKVSRHQQSFSRRGPRPGSFRQLIRLFYYQHVRNIIRYAPPIHTHTPSLSTSAAPILLCV